jgi:hypothetical protein
MRIKDGAKSRQPEGDGIAKKKLARRAGTFFINATILPLIAKRQGSA